MYGPYTIDKKQCGLLQDLLWGPYSYEEFKKAGRWKSLPEFYDSARRIYKQEWVAICRRKCNKIYLQTQIQKWRRGREKSYSLFRNDLGKRLQMRHTQMPLFTPETEWVMPDELKDLRDAKEVAIDLETNDPMELLAVDLQR